MAFALVVASPALASAPGPSAPGNAPQQSVANPTPKAVPAQNPAWIAMKEKGQIRRAGYHVFSNSFPSADKLAIGIVETTLEPSANIASPYLYNRDDADTSYTDHNMVDLCGPGAIANALFEWNASLANNAGLWTDLSVQNTKPPGVTVTTYWGGQSLHDNPPLQGSKQFAHRGEILYLAWLSNPGNQWAWNNTGVMDDWHYPSNGTRLDDTTSVLNWEASGYSTYWADFFYITQWGTGTYFTQSYLLSDVETDIYESGAPVVAEVDASDLPEWSTTGLIRHDITIIGYDNNKGWYYYTDTCGNSTGCGANSQQTVYHVPQHQMWTAIMDVPYDQSTGDGGWVW
jgi:hypothetical protein